MLAFLCNKPVHAAKETADGDLTEKQNNRLAAVYRPNRRLMAAAEGPHNE